MESKLYPNSYHLLQRTPNDVRKDEYKDYDREIIIGGHRGGSFPFNSMYGFRKAKDFGLQVIEFDCWLTKDDQICIIHGSVDGTMPVKINEPDDAPLVNIYDLTYEEVKEHFLLTKDWADSMPYLE